MLPKLIVHFFVLLFFLEQAKCAQEASERDDVIKELLDKVAKSQVKVIIDCCMDLLFYVLLDKGKCTIRPSIYL